MSYTYNIADTADISSMMRLELGDNQLDPNGILPDGKNFSDAELDYFYTQEDSDFWPAVARAFDAAAARWAQYPDTQHIGPEMRKMPAAAFYRMRAKEIRTSQYRAGVYDVSKEDYAISE